ncbi:oxidoreductase [Chromatiales bacterium (ex Bugula neritina AB1)]|nr:oxidoreductase [Chromatiales bacterium (ex Bugula neritina AB1)]
MCFQEPVKKLSLPIIDISDLTSSDQLKRQNVGETLRAACQDRGFFYCTGHGIADRLINEVLEQTSALFSQPQDKKMAVEKSNSGCNRGYETLGGQTLDAGGQPDRKEGYYIGVELPDTDPRVIAGRFNRGPNLWPSDLSDFQPVMSRYFAAMESLGATLMQGIALSLELPGNYFSSYNSDTLATLRLLHYPPQPPDEPDRMGAGAHTDFGGLTILLQDNNGGLQVWNRADNTWDNAPPQKGAFIVNLGDMIARWTNDRYKSTLHRVINTSGRERYSVPFFYVGNPDFEVKCIPGCLDQGELPRYPPVTVEEHLMSMYNKTYGS